MEQFFSADMEGRFQAFSWYHWVTVGIIIAGAVLLYLFRHRLQRGSHNRRGQLFIAVTLLLCEILFQIWAVATDQWTAADWLPFQLCSISLLLCAIMLITKSRQVYEVVFFTGIGGALMAILTPELSYPFPHFRYIHFFLAHAFILYACFYATWVMNYRPTLFSIAKTMLYLNLYLVFVFGVNDATGGNYMFVSHKPAQASLMDFLGEYPWYLLSLEGVAVVLFFLIYLPFWIRDRLKPL